MTKTKKIKDLLKRKLSEVFDPLMKENNFKRRKNSIVYQKKNNILSHKIYFHLQLSPSFIPGADAYLNPTYRLFIPEVSRKVLEIMEDNIYFQDSSGIVIAQPLYVFDEDSDINPYLSLTLNKDNSRDLNQMKKLILNYALPEINKVNTIDDFIKIYEDGLPFLITKNTFIYFIVAYLLIGQEKKAQDLLEEKFSKKGAKRMYKPLHKNFPFL